MAKNSCWLLIGSWATGCNLNRHIAIVTHSKPGYAAAFSWSSWWCSRTSFWASRLTLASGLLCWQTVWQKDPDIGTFDNFAIHLGWVGHGSDLWERDTIGWNILTWDQSAATLRPPNLLFHSLFLIAGCSISCTLAPKSKSKAQIEVINALAGTWTWIIWIQHTTHLNNIWLISRSKEAFGIR